MSEAWRVQEVQIRGQATTPSEFWITNEGGGKMRLSFSDNDFAGPKTLNGSDSASQKPSSRSIITDRPQSHSVISLHHHSSTTITIRP